MGIHPIESRGSDECNFYRVLCPKCGCPTIGCCFPEIDFNGVVYTSNGVFNLCTECKRCGFSINGFPGNFFFVTGDENEST